MHPAIAAKHDEVTLRVSRVVDAMSVKYFGGAISQQPTHAHGDASIAPSAVPSVAPRTARRTALSAIVPLRELSATQTAAWLANRGHSAFAEALVDFDGAQLCDPHAVLDRIAHQATFEDRSTLTVRYIFFVERYDSILLYFNYY